MSIESSNNAEARKNRLINSMAGLIFCVLGMLVIFESQRFESSGSVTPILVGIVLIVLSLVLIVISFVAPQQLPLIKQPEGSLKRRSVGAFVIVVWVMLLPFLGFLLTSTVAFFAISMTVPVQHPRSLFTCCLHAVIGALIVTFFWFFLTRYLGIALPELRSST